jgi:hypothetical protein
MKLCSKITDVQRRIRVFYRRLLRRGYSKEQLTPLFNKAIVNTHQHFCRTTQELKLLQDRKLVQGFHLQYHPNDPDSRTIQQIWREQVLEPTGHQRLNQIRNHENQRIPIDQLTIAYSRPPNFGNLFSVRKFHKKRGPNVSSFI